MVSHPMGPVRCSTIAAADATDDGTPSDSEGAAAGLQPTIRAVMTSAAITAPPYRALSKRERRGIWILLPARIEWLRPSVPPSEVEQLLDGRGRAPDHHLRRVVDHLVATRLAVDGLEEQAHGLLAH